MSILAAAMLAAFAVRADDKPATDKPTWQDATVMAAADALILVDMIQTTDLVNHPQMQEWNPLLGRHPSDLRIFAGGALVMWGLAAAVYYLPPRWRLALPFAVIGAESFVIAKNHENGLRIAF